MILALNHIPNSSQIVPPQSGNTTELECLCRSNRAHSCPAVNTWTEMLRRGIHAASRQYELFTAEGLSYADVR